MTARWNYVWGKSGSSCCPPSCYNFTQSCNNSPQGNILDNFPISVQSAGQAMAEIGNSIKTRTGATNVLVTTVSQSTYTLDLSFGVSSADRASATFQFSGTSGNFPLTVSYSKGRSSGSSSFSDLGQAVEYLALVLR